MGLQFIDLPGGPGMFNTMKIFQCFEHKKMKKIFENFLKFFLPLPPNPSDWAETSPVVSTQEVTIWAQLPRKRGNPRKMIMPEITAVCSGIFKNIIFTEFQLLTKGPYN